jgi:hypothetical protein
MEPIITWTAAGACELLFPPRVGSLYGSRFLWSLILAIFLKWFISREIGRYSVSTGRCLLEGYKEFHFQDVKAKQERAKSIPQPGKTLESLLP